MFLDLYAFMNAHLVMGWVMYNLVFDMIEYISFPGHDITTYSFWTSARVNPNRKDLREYV